MSNNKKNTSAVRLPRQSRPHRSFTVREGEERGLLAYLTEIALKDRSRTTVKQLLHDRFISVNDEATTQWDRPLAVGEVVTLHPAPLPSELRHKQVEILWQDEHLVMIHKMAGIPTVASGDEKDKTALEIVSEHLKKFNPRSKVFLLNRIDKDSTGFVLMAKSEALQQEMSDRWEQYVERQTFALSVHGTLPSEEGTLHAPSEDDKRDKARRSKQLQGAVMAGEARYRVLQTTPLGSLVVATLLRGRNNRLRKQMAQLKCPIIGDWRNGSPRKELGHVALETIAFSFVHPITGRKYDFEQPIPGNFRRLLTDPETGRKVAKPSKRH